MKYGIERTQTFENRFSGIKDKTVRGRLLARFALVENGHFGDYRELSENLFELRCFLAVE